MSSPALCIYTSLFTLAGRDPENNQYIWIYFTWLWSLLLNGGLDVSRDRIVVHIDPDTYSFIKNIELHNELQMMTAGILEYYIHPAPTTLLEGLFNRYNKELIHKLLSHPNYKNTLFLYMDIDIIFQKPLRSLPWPSLEPDQIFISLEVQSIYGDCYVGAFISHCTCDNEVKYHDTTLREFMHGSVGITSGMFGFTAGDGVKSVFNEIQILKQFGAGAGKYYEQGCFNYAVSKFHIFGAITQNHAPLSLREYVGINENKDEAIISLMGEVGDGVFHLEKVLGYLFTRAGPYKPTSV